MDSPKFYWLKLKRDFFKRHDIRIIEDMPNGKDYILFYLKLLCESVDHDGNLRFSENIPYNEHMLATITCTNVDVVRSAIKVFTDLEMMSLLDDGTFYMNEVQRMIGSAADNDNANRQRRFRERQKELALQDVTKCNASVTNNNESKSIEIELEKEKELEIEIEGEEKPAPKKPKKEKPVKHKYGEYQNVLLSDEDLEKLKNEFPTTWQRWIEKVSCYCKSKGKSYTDYLATIRNWARKDGDREADKANSYRENTAYRQATADLLEELRQEDERDTRRNP